MRWRLLMPVAALFALMVLGTVGYMLLEHLTLTNALYLTTATVSTVGYGDVVPVTTGGKLFTVFLIMTGVGTALYLLSQLAELVIEGKLRELFGRNVMEREIAKLENHVIVCGFGRFGRAVVEELLRSRSPLVIIDSDPARQDDLASLGVPYLIGSALLDETLDHAGVDRARAIVVATPSDSDNVFITLSARERNPRISIHSRAESEAGARRLQLAGATQVISAYQSGGTRIAASILRPAVVDFLEISTLGRGEEDIALEEIRAAASCPMIGRTIGALEQQSPRLRIVALKRNGEPTRITPDGSTPVSEGDYLVVIGERTSLAQLAQLAQGA
ncbi:MAG TPA: NAD-binding protein [Candidatus Binatia bacterium]|nr:NAD-binding protein [Candidatus Binatia bacterium]